MGPSWHIRRFTEADRPAQAALLAAAGSDFADLATLRAWDSNDREAGRILTRHVAEVDGEVVGFGEQREMVWNAAPGRRLVKLAIAPQHRRQGGGQALMAAVDQEARSSGATTMVASGPNEAAALAFMSGWGFEVVDLDFSMVLSPVTVPDPLPPVPRGVVIATLGQLMADRPDWLDRLYALVGEGSADIPSALGPTTMPDIAEFRRIEIEDPSARPDAVHIAADGAGNWVAMSELRLPTPGHGRQEMTCVARGWRGRGLATAVKGSLLQWAAENGVQRIGTECNQRNAAMVAVNRKLGFEVESTWALWKRVL